ncbi:MAG: fibrobacter succinogenes major paralogous domain-containing protein [Ignavibacteria bacterium]
MEKRVSYKSILNSMLSVIITLMIYGCQSPIEQGNVRINEAEITYDSTDIAVGNQIWMSRNVKTVVFRNGDTIFQAKNMNEWLQAGLNKKPAWCMYNYDSINGSKYGNLYNFYAVIDSRGLAPRGYHVPTDKEWDELCIYIGGESQAGRKLKGIQLGGENEIRFNALLGGANYIDSCKHIEQSGFWWTSTENIPHRSWARQIEKNSSILYRMFAEQFCGFSVRCLRNK